ncbi:MAG: flagellar type III secretion system pore protein FliP [Ilumatobacteraceae bacterium]|nr:flagellar type III secretion system pore protein FliP [Acidimicrobiaceae bacterium]
MLAATFVAVFALALLIAPRSAGAAGSAMATPGTAPAAAPEPDVPEIPEVSDPFDRPSNLPGGDDNGDGSDASIDVNFPNVTEDPSNSVVIILLLTVLSLAPSLLVLCTSFTRIVIVLSLTRNALGIPTVPPQQVVVGLSVFLTLFIMGPTLSEMKEAALDPMLAGEITTSEALDAAQGPLREFLLAHTREGELEMFLDASGTDTPVARDEVPLNALIPAFVLSELKSGFIIGFVIFIPFLVIDLVVSAVLMALGMMMLPPSFVSLPFKLLLFVMLDGWMLVIGTLLTSYG